MKKVTYPLLDGSHLDVTYDENAPCIICGLPVVAASMGGTVVCPWCDTGYYRDGTRQMTLNKDVIRREAANRLKPASKPLDLRSTINEKPIVINNRPLPPIITHRPRPTIIDNQPKPKIIDNRKTF